MGKRIINFLKNSYDIISVILGVLLMFGITMTAIVNFFSSNRLIIVASLLLIVLVLLIVYYVKYKRYKKLQFTSKEQNEKLINDHKIEIENVKKMYEDELEDLKFFKERLKKLGIIDCTLKLKDTEFTPEFCMKTIKKKLLFSGVSGAKWIEKTENKDLFEKMLKQIQNNNGTVKFLMINPYCDDFKELNYQRNKQMNTQVYKIWKDLEKKYKCLEVRCYSHMPAFRIQLMDDDKAAISRYLIDEEQYKKYDKGWDNPHLIIEYNREISFYTIFESQFLKEWNDAIDIKEIKR